MSACKDDGGVEGGVSSSSADEADSTTEDVSETREGVRDTGRELTCSPGRVVDNVCCEEVPRGRGVARRGRGTVFLCLGADNGFEGLDIKEFCASGNE